MNDDIRHTGSSDSAWDFFECDAAALAAASHRSLNKDVRDAGFTLVKGKSHFHRFQGGGEGISYTAIIMESHIAIHTNPENHRLIEVTIHTCNMVGVVAAVPPEVKKEKLLRLWERRFKARVLPLVSRERGRIEQLQEYERFQILATYAKKVA